MADILHVKNAAIIVFSDVENKVVRILSKGQLMRDSFSFQQSDLFTTFLTEKKPQLVSSNVFINSIISKEIASPDYYLFPCLDSQGLVTACIVSAIHHRRNFEPENFSLVQVVGQRLAVELEKTVVLKEKKSLSEFNAFIIESLGEVTWDYSIVRKNIDWFGAISNVFGYEKKEMGLDLSNLFSRIHPSDRVMIEDKMTVNHIEGEKFSLDFQFLKKDGEYRWLRVDGITISSDAEKAKRVIGVFKDVHSEKLAERERISAMIKTKDGERKRIASEIHDSLGQTLSVARLELDSLSELLRDEKYEKRISSISKLVLGAINDSRAISHNLMPPALIDYGLISAVETMVKTLNRSSNIEFKFFHNEGCKRFGEEFEVNVYRMFQEGVNNILKHSRASTAVLQFIEHPAYVFISMEDDGVGLVKMSDLDGGLGLKNMENRVSFLGGNISYENQNGFIVTIEISI